VFTERRREKADNSTRKMKKIISLLVTNDFIKEESIASAFMMKWKESKQRKVERRKKRGAISGSIVAPLWTKGRITKIKIAMRTTMRLVEAKIFRELILIKDRVVWSLMVSVFQ
jgi:hypothetical protein